MPTALSVEGRISAILSELHCSARQFIEIAREKGVNVSAFTLSQAMNDVRPLDPRIGQQLLEIASLMRSTQSYFADMPLSWGESEKIALLLVFMLLRSVSVEQHNDVLLDAAETVLAQEFRNHD
jgi:hypothetical protein